MKGKSYTFFIASSASGGMRRLRVPIYALHLLTILAVVGGITVLAGVASYSECSSRPRITIHFDANRTA